jgi:alkanesulfonate monooxygenase SsuD/methylene tetrahydromethanopterin reductase-like flavin-dependent oxidoreductase (luciferase family)
MFVLMLGVVSCARVFAALDSLSLGRVVAGVGIGWNETEFANVGAADRFHARGAYLDETIALWRHLWSGSSEAFHGRFHTIDDFVFGPLPVQAPLPIVICGRAEPALRRAGRTADGYQSSSASPAAYAERVAVVRSAAETAGRPTPWLSARAQVRFGDHGAASYAMHGSPDEIAAEVRAFAALGVEHIALAFGTTDPGEVVTFAERFANEVVPLV